MSITFVATRKGEFASLIQSTSLGPFVLEALPPVTLRDRYLDTDDCELLRRGMRLLVRDADGELTAHLVGVEEAGSSRKWVGSLLQERLNPTGRSLTSAFELSHGDLQDALLEYIEGDRLVPLLQLRQHRTRRIVRDGEREVASLSFDVVVFEDPAEPVISNEAVLEVSDAGTSEDVRALSGIFHEVGLEREARSAFERVILRTARPLDEAVLLLPDEREALERIASTGDGREQRSARVILLDSRGFRDMKIADETGFGTPTVRRLRHAFRQSRMGLFEYLLEQVPPEPVQESASDARSDVHEGRCVSNRGPATAQSDVAIQITDKFEDIDGLLEAFRRVESETPRFTEPAESDIDAADGIEDAASVASVPEAREVASRLQQELNQLDRYTLAARASTSDSETVGGVLYSAHRILVFLDWLQPLASRSVSTNLTSPLKAATKRADDVLDYSTAARNRKSGSLLRERDNAAKAFRALLQGRELVTWREEVRQLVLELGNTIDAGDANDKGASLGRLLVSALRSRFDGLRQLAQTLNGDDADPSQLYRLATSTFALRVLLEEADLGEEAGSLRSQLSDAEQTLARARHVRVCAELTGDISMLDRGPNADSVQAVLEALCGNELGEAFYRAVSTL